MNSRALLTLLALAIMGIAALALSRGAEPEETTRGANGLEVQTLGTSADVAAQEPNPMRNSERLAISPPAPHDQAVSGEQERAALTAAPADVQAAGSTEPAVYAANGEVGRLVAPGVVRSYGPSGEVLGEGGWREGEKDGYWTYFDSETGQETLSGHYVAGLAEGEWISRDSVTGEVLSRGNCRAGKLHGPCWFYAETDTRVDGLYRDGELVEAF